LFADGGQKGFVVGERGKRMAFEEKSEMFDGRESGQEFSVKSRIKGFCCGKLLEKKERGCQPFVFC
jgi:hypothetical protein